MAFNIKFTKFDNTTWGFRLTGGSDFPQPLTVIRVTEGSLAECMGLKVGDIVVRLNDQPVSGLTHGEAHEALVRAGNNFVLAVQREPDSDKALEALQGENLIPYKSLNELQPLHPEQILHERTVFEDYEEVTIQSGVPIVPQSVADDKPDGAAEPEARPEETIERGELGAEEEEARKKREEEQEKVPEKPIDANSEVVPNQNLTDDEIAQLILQEEELLLPDQGVLGVNFKKLRPRAAILKGSKVLEELEKVETEPPSKVEQLRRTTTFLQKPQRPVPLPRGPQQESEKTQESDVEGYRVVIKKQQKKSVTERLLEKGLLEPRVISTPEYRSEVKMHVPGVGESAENGEKTDPSSQVSGEDASDESLDAPFYAALDEVLADDSTNEASPTVNRRSNDEVSVQVPADRTSDDVLPAEDLPSGQPRDSSILLEGIPTEPAVSLDSLDCSSSQLTAEAEVVPIDSLSNSAEECSAKRGSAGSTDRSEDRSIDSRSELAEECSAKRRSVESTDGSENRSVASKARFFVRPRYFQRCLPRCLDSRPSPLSRRSSWTVKTRLSRRRMKGHYAEACLAHVLTSARSFLYRPVAARRRYCSRAHYAERILLQSLRLATRNLSLACPSRLLNFAGTYIETYLKRDDTWLALLARSLLSTQTQSSDSDHFQVPPRRLSSARRSSCAKAHYAERAFVRSVEIAAEYLCSEVLLRSSRPTASNTRTKARRLFAKTRYFRRVLEKSVDPLCNFFGDSTLVAGASKSISFSARPRVRLFLRTKGRYLESILSRRDFRLSSLLIDLLDKIVTFLDSLRRGLESKGTSSRGIFTIRARYAERVVVRNLEIVRLLTEYVRCRVLEDRDFARIEASDEPSAIVPSDAGQLSQFLQSAGSVISTEIFHRGSRRLSRSCRGSFSSADSQSWLSYLKSMKVDHGWFGSRKSEDQTICSDKIRDPEHDGRRLSFIPTILYEGLTNRIGVDFTRLVAYAFVPCTSIVLLYMYK